MKKALAYYLKDSYSSRAYFCYYITYNRARGIGLSEAALRRYIGEVYGDEKKYPYPDCKRATSKGFRDMSRFRRYIDGHSKLYLCPYTSCKFSRGKGLGTKEALSMHKKRAYNSLRFYYSIPNCEKATRRGLSYKDSL